MMELILSGQMKDDNDSGRYSETECDNFCGVRQQLLILGSIIIVLCHTDQLPVNPCIMFHSVLKQSPLIFGETHLSTAVECTWFVWDLFSVRGSGHHQFIILLSDRGLFQISEILLHHHLCNVWSIWSSEWLQQEKNNLSPLMNLSCKIHKYF